MLIREDERKCSVELDCDPLLHRIAGCQPGDLDRSIPGRGTSGEVDGKLSGEN